jgi:hypothetical protein
MFQNWHSLWEKKIVSATIAVSSNDNNNLRSRVVVPPRPPALPCPVKTIGYSGCDVRC